MKKLVKNILLSMVAKFARSHDKQIKKAQKWIDHAQETFANALEEAIIAEEQFNKVITDAQEKMEELKVTVAEAESKKVKAVNFQDKISKFVEE